MFVLTGASVEIPHKVYKALGYLGPKLYFLRIPSHDKTQEERLANLSENFGDKEGKIQAALFDYLKWLEIRPDMQIDNESGLPKIEWDHSKDDKEALIYIIKLADLLAPLRGVSQTWETRGTQGSDYGYTIPIVEDSSRATTQLYNLARGHALSQGRNYVTKEDIHLIIKVVLSTGPVERVRILDTLIADNGDLTTGQITGALSIASQTAKRTMIELTLLGLVDIYPKLGTEDQEQHQGVEKKITLRQKFREWLDSKEFKELRKGFVPTDNNEYLKEGEKQDDKV